jgi:hypothetical protein
MCNGANCRFCHIDIPILKKVTHRNKLKNASYTTLFLPAFFAMLKLRRFDQALGQPQTGFLITTAIATPRMSSSRGLILRKRLPDKLKR